MELIREFVSGSARARSQRASALNHKIGNDAMKREAVVKGTFRFLVGLGIGKLLGSLGQADKIRDSLGRFFFKQAPQTVANFIGLRSEEHTAELQSPCNLVCRLLLEKKKRQAIAHFR